MREPFSQDSGQSIARRHHQFKFTPTGTNRKAITPLKAPRAALAPSEEFGAHNANTVWRKFRGHWQALSLSNSVIIKTVPKPSGANWCQSHRKLCQDQR
jgi:hypothetical protein